ncbi:MAG: STAS domain-containing protein [Nocardioidaceae bacterium]|nr:STAS domain-containing protein [Nocardioidaceae bacterium]
MREVRRGTGQEGCLDIRVEHSGSEIVLVLVGPLDVRSTAPVRDAVYEQVQVGGESLSVPVVIDITEVSSVDATALRVLAVASRQAQRYGVRLVLRGACPAVRRMLRLTHMIRVVEIEREGVRVS